MEKTVRVVTLVSIVFFLGNFGCQGSNAGIEDNWVFDLNKPLPPTDAASNSNVVFHPMNYSISQDDPRLTSLGGNLCFPVALAESLMCLYHYRAPNAFPHLRLGGISPDGHYADPIALTKQLATLCKTNAISGTIPLDGAYCIGTIVTNSGYQINSPFLITWAPMNDPSPQFPYENRPPTLKDLRQGIDNSEGVLLGIGRYHHGNDGSWQRFGGHVVGVYGYEDSKILGQLSLRILNPHTRFPNDGNHILYEVVTISSIETSPPSMAISGPGFEGQVALVEAMYHFLPY